MSFVGPTTLEGWKGVPVRAARWPRRPACRPSSRSTSPPPPWASGSTAPAATSATSTTSISASASAAAWCMTAPALRGACGNAGEIGHMPVVPGGDPCPCGNRGCLERYLSLEACERRRAGDRRGRLDRRGGAAVPHRRRHHREPVRSRDDHGRRPRAATRCSSGSSTRPSRCRNSIAERRDRTRAAGHRSPPSAQDAVLRGAAALAVSGVLSPRFGMMFAEGRGRHATR